MLRKNRGGFGLLLRFSRGTFLLLSAVSGASLTRLFAMCIPIVRYINLTFTFCSYYKEIDDELPIHYLMTNSVKKNEKSPEEGDGKIEATDLEQFIHKTELQNKILKKISENLEMPVHLKIKGKDPTS